MKQRTNLRMILIFCIMVLAVLLIGSTKVEADGYPTGTQYGIVTSGTITKDNIPDTFNVNIKEAEFEKTPQIVFEQLVAKLQEQGITVEKYNYEKNEYGNLDIFGDYISQKADGKDYIAQVYCFDMKKAHIKLSNYEEDIIVNVVYNNSNQYNTETKRTVEQKANNLNLPKYKDTYDCTTKREIGTKGNIVESITQNAIDSLTKAFNDNSITVVGGITADGGWVFEPFEDCTARPFYIFKDGVYYTTIDALCGSIYNKITVPSNVEDIESYAISKIKALINQHNQDEYNQSMQNEVEFIKLTKVSGDNYKVCWKYKDNSQEEYNDIVIKKSTSDNTGNTGTTETKPITKEDKTTGIKIEGNISANITISSNKVTDQAIINKVADALKNISNKYVTYDISLLENGTKVQPNGKIKVSIPIPSGYDTSKLVVYRVTESGEKIEYKPIISGNYATIETDHFSTYVLAETGTVKAPSQDKPNTSASNSNKLDDTPKTGVNNVILVSSAIVSIISLAGIILIKRK